MTQLNTYFLRLFSAILLLVLTGCQTIDVRGQFVSDTAIEKLSAQKPTKQEVTDMIGSPTYIPDYSKNTWYYIQRSLARKAWFTPKVTEQRIIKITFNSKDKLKKVQLLENLQNENISAKSQFTKTHGTEKSGIQTFVKNIGRFNKTSTGSNRSKKKK
ncbi:MAG: cell envelope protein SmpA [Rickettsiales bacterium]|nr:MAG: cell envelope protein SmpA [Rickettsiales bacterium]